MNFKLRPVVAYPLFFVALALGLALVLFLSRGTKTGTADTPPASAGNPAAQTNPTEPPPSKENVSPEFKHELSQLETAVKNNPTDTLSMRKLADFYASGHRPADAEELYNKILKVNPKRADIYFALSVLAFIKKDFDKATEITNKVLAFDKNNTQALYNLGAIAATKGETAKAKEIWTALIARFPSSPQAQVASESLKQLK